MNTKESFGLVSVLLHWSMAALIFSMFPLGLYVTGLDYMHPWYRSAPLLHKGVGLVVFALLVLRAVWTSVNVRPEDVSMPRWERMAARTVQRLFYVLILGVAASGYLISTADGRGLEFFGWFEVPAVVSGHDRQEDLAGSVHLALASVTVALACLHGLAALKHHFLNRDSVLMRMFGLGPKRIALNKVQGGNMKKLGTLLFILAVGLILLPHAALAENYVIDTKKAHAFIQFKISHLGYSWLLGRFNTFEGTFSYDEKDPSVSKVEVKIDPASVDTNHAERDKHLRGKDFLDVKKFPEARFVSTSLTPRGNGEAVLKGDFTLHGVTRPIEIEVKEIGAGNDPWGGFRRGFEGRTKFALHDYGIDYNLGPASREVELFLSIEGIRQ